MSGYELLKAVQQLPIKELKNTSTNADLLTKLRNGDQIEVSINVNGVSRKLSIEANPQFKTMNILDDSGEKISIAAALGKERKLGQPQVKELKQDTKISRKNSVWVG